MNLDKRDFCQLLKSKVVSSARTIFYKIRVAWPILQHRSINKNKMVIGLRDQVEADYLCKMVRRLRMFSILCSSTPMLKEECIITIRYNRMTIGHKKVSKSRWSLWRKPNKCNLCRHLIIEVKDLIWMPLHLMVSNPRSMIDKWKIWMRRFRGSPGKSFQTRISLARPSTMTRSSADLK